MEGIMKRLTVADFIKKAVKIENEKTYNRKIVVAIGRLSGRVEYFHINRILESGDSNIMLFGSYEDMDSCDL